MFAKEINFLHHFRAPKFYRLREVTSLGKALREESPARLKARKPSEERQPACSAGSRIDARFQGAWTGLPVHEFI